MLQVDQIVGELEAHTLVVDQQFAEGHAARGIGGRDRLGAQARSEPARTMREARGSETHLGIDEPVADRAQDLGFGNADILEVHQPVPPGHGTVDGLQLAFEADAGRRKVDEKQGGTGVGPGHDDAHRSAGCAGDECLAAVDDPLAAFEPGHAHHHAGIGAGAVFRRRFGHEERRARHAADQGLEEPRLLRRRRNLGQQVHVALVGSRHIDGHHSQRRPAGRAQHHRQFAMRQMRPIRGKVRGEDARVARLAPEFRDQLLTGSVRTVARILFVRDRNLLHEAQHPLRDRLCT